MDINVAIGLAGFYMALTSLLGSIFTINLVNWLQKIEGVNAGWEKNKHREIGGLDEKAIEVFLSLRIDSAQLKSCYLFFGWIIVTLFIIVIIVFLHILTNNVNSDEGIILFYILNPVWIFFGLYFLSSVFLLWKGYSKSRTLFSKIEEKMDVKVTSE